MQLRSLSLFIVLILFHFYNSNSLASNFDLKSFEEEFSEKMKHAEEKSRFYLYASAGRELMSYRIYPMAIKYYSLALEQKTTESKNPVFISLLEMAYFQKDRDFFQKIFEQLNEYWSQNPQLQIQGKKEYAEALLYLTSWYKPDDKNFLEKFNTIQGVTSLSLNSGGVLQFKKENYYSLFRQGQYKQSLEYLDQQKVIHSKSVDLQSEYDLLTLLESKETAKNHHLTCTKLGKKYEKSYSYGVLLCRILSEYQKQGSIQKKDIQELRDYFETFDQELSFIPDAVSKLPLI